MTEWKPNEDCLAFMMLDDDAREALKGSDGFYDLEEITSFGCVDYLLNVSDEIFFSHASKIAVERFASDLRLHKKWEPNRTGFAWKAVVDYGSSIAGMEVQRALMECGGKFKIVGPYNKGAYMIRANGVLITAACTLASAIEWVEDIGGEVVG